MPAPRPLLFELERLGLDLNKTHTAKEVRAAQHAEKVRARWVGVQDPVSDEPKKAKKEKEESKYDAVLEEFSGPVVFEEPIVTQVEVPKPELKNEGVEERPKAKKSDSQPPPPADTKGKKKAEKK